MINNSLAQISPIVDDGSGKSFCFLFYQSFTDGPRNMQSEKFDESNKTCERALMYLKEVLSYLTNIPKNNLDD